MAFHDSEAGHSHTIRNPTGGFHEASVMPDGSYRIQVLESLLPTCGRVQFDAQAYLATGGLDPSQLHSLMFDTGVDCSPRQAARRLSLSAVSADANGRGTGLLEGGTGIPEGQEAIVSGSGSPASFAVPDESSSLLLLAFSLIGGAVWRASQVAGPFRQLAT